MEPNLQEQSATDRLLSNKPPFILSESLSLQIFETGAGSLLLKTESATWGEVYWQSRSRRQKIPEIYEA